MILSKRTLQLVILKRCNSIYYNHFASQWHWCVMSWKNPFGDYSYDVIKMKEDSTCIKPICLPITRSCSNIAFEMLNHFSRFDKWYRKKINSLCNPKIYVQPILRKERASLLAVILWKLQILDDPELNFA